MNKFANHSGHFRFIYMHFDFFFLELIEQNCFCPNINVRKFDTSFIINCILYNRKAKHFEFGNVIILFNKLQAFTRVHFEENLKNYGIPKHDQIELCSESFSVTNGQ